MSITIRKGIKKDLPDILMLIRDLAEYENSLDQVTITLDQLEDDGFGANPSYYFIVAVTDKVIIGMSFTGLDILRGKESFYF
jgi:hypothetical protein